MDEVQFKIALAVLLVIDAGIRLYYQRGCRDFKKSVVKHEQRERLLYYLVGLGIIPVFIYLFTSLIDAFRILFNSDVRWLGAGIIFTGDLLFIWPHRSLGKNWSPVLEIRKGHTLITDGPYRFIRHPMYAAIFLIGIGVLFLSANWIVSLCYMLPVICMYILRVPSEEKMMTEHFGSEYRKYMKKTGRLVPKLSILMHRKRT